MISEFFKPNLKYEKETEIYYFLYRFNGIYINTVYKLQVVSLVSVYTVSNSRVVSLVSVYTVSNSRVVSLVSVYVVSNSRVEYLSIPNLIQFCQESRKI